MPTDPDNLSEAQRHHLRYWTAFCEYVAQRGSFTERLKPQARFWVQFPAALFGRSDIRLGAHNYLRGRERISVELNLSGPRAKSRFDLLSREREQIEGEIGARLEWHRKPDQESSKIYLELPNVDPTNGHDWPRQHDWLLKKLEAFYRAFAPRVRRL